MKLNKFFMLGLAGLAFAACSNEENAVPTDNTDGKVYLSLSLGAAKTRSLCESAVDKTNAVKNLKVFFYTSSGQYVYYEPDAAILSAAVDKLGAKGSATIELTEVPGSATRIHVIANEKEINPVHVGSWHDVENSPIYLRNQVKTSGVVKFCNEESTMTGYAEILEKTKVTLTPVTGRMEVRNFIAQKAPEEFLGNDIKEFKVKGIYINSFYTEGKLENIDLNERDRVFIEDYSLAGYEEYPYLCDEPKYAPEENSTATSGAYTENNGIWKVSPVSEQNWWGYVVLKGYAPDMIIKLDVIYEGEETPVERYLTVQKYKKASGSSDLTTFERGYVYRIENFLFDATNLTEKPYESTKTVSAIVTVAKWTGVDILPNFGN